jgi:hypothetical protein
MTLETTYREFIIEKLHKEYLYDGTLPSSEDIADDLAEYQKDHPDFNRPASKDVDFNVLYGGISSASLIENIKQHLDDDVSVLTREIYRLSKESQRMFDRWLSEIGRIESRATRLEQRTDSLLMMKDDTAGYFSTIEGNFTDLNTTDTVNTTAEVNIKEQAVKINPSISNSVDSSGGTLVDLNDITDARVSFSPISTKAGTSYYALNEENSLKSIFRTDNSTWVGKISSTKSSEMVSELKAQVSVDKDKEITSISMNYTGPCATSRATVTLMTSIDGYSWKLVPSVLPTKSITSKMLWTFPLTKLRWIKFIFQKPCPDTSNNEYIYSISSIKLFGKIYDEELGNTYISDSLYAKDKSGEPILFSKISLDICEETPENTSIKYYISGSKDNSIWTDWLPISPKSSKDINYPKVINFSGADWKDNNSEETPKIYESDEIPQKSITTEFDESYIGYKFKNDTFGMVNTAIKTSLEEDITRIGNSIVLWRNIRDKDSTDYPDIQTVRNVQRGWGLSGSNYSCYFEIINSNGIIIDFGNRPCELDGQLVSGIVNINSGIHKFSTSADYWQDISTSIVDLSLISTEETLSSIDPLYPYNHKYLIEGFPYPIGFKGDKKYKGTDISAEFYCKKISLFNLENNIDDLGKFAVKSIGPSDSPTIGIVLRFDPTNSDFSNELTYVKWRSGDTNATMYKYLKLKAILSTDDTTVTPILTAYRIKLGL